MRWKFPHWNSYVWYIHFGTIIVFHDYQRLRRIRPIHTTVSYTHLLSPRDTVCICERWVREVDANEPHMCRYRIILRSSRVVVCCLNKPTWERHVSRFDPYKQTSKITSTTGRSTPSVPVSGIRILLLFVLLLTQPHHGLSYYVCTSRLNTPDHPRRQCVSTIGGTRRHMLAG